MKMSTGKLDLFTDEMGDYNATGGFIDIRANDAIAYVSPNFSGLTLVGAIVPDADYDGNGDFGGAYSIAAMYSNGGLFLAAAWEQLDDVVDGVNANNLDSEHWRIGAGFDMGSFHIGAIYAQQDMEYFTGDNTKNLLINGAWKFGNNKLKAEWGQVDPDNGSKTNAWAVGLDHNFSKRTKMYVQYADSEHGLQSTNYKGMDQTGVSFGMVHKF
jgi:predicted porin